MRRDLMQKLLKRVRAALRMGAMWGTVWLPIGPLIGFIVDRDGSMDEPWIAVGALPGFLGGVAFSVVLMIAERRRRFDALTLKRVAGWGAMAGLLVVLIPYVASLPEPAGRFPTVLGIALAVGLLSAVSAAGSLALARKGNFNFVGDSADEAEVGLEGGETSRKSR